MISHKGFQFLLAIFCSLPVTFAFANGNPQKNIWDLIEKGENAKAKELEAQIENELKESEFSIDQKRPLTERSSQMPRKVVFPSGTVAILKKQIFDNKGRSQFASEAEVAAFRLDRLFGFNRVPLTVKRTIENIDYSIQVFVDDYRAKIDLELNDGEISSLVFFDTLIANSDRHNKNFGRSGERLVLIDHDLSLGFWEFESFVHKTYEFHEPKLSVHEAKSFLRVSEDSILSTLSDLNIEQDRLNALVKRFRKLRALAETWVPNQMPVSDCDGQLSSTRR